jgi:uncharacterized protein (DUF1501 family)
MLTRRIFVRGSAVDGKWPDMEKERLYEGRDLAVTYRFPRRP